MKYLALLLLLSIGTAVPLSFIANETGDIPSSETEKAKQAITEEPCD